MLGASVLSKGPISQSVKIFVWPSRLNLCFRDRSFSLNDFLRGLRSELKSWRKVFWRLWGMVHPLYCSLCSAAYPVYLNEFCRFHPQVLNPKLRMS